MSEARKLLENLIHHFSAVAFSRFFREKSRQFIPEGSDYRFYNDPDFQQGLKLGEIHFPDGDHILICAFGVQKPLAERSGKKAQYEKAKSILRSAENQYFAAGIFIFHDSSGNFRFSLVYPESTGTRRQWSHFRRFTYYVSRELTNKTFLQRIGDGDFSSLAKIKDAFSVEKVTTEFYQDIANWYFWAVDYCEFPKDAEADTNGRNIAVIRLITRLIFIWFMRERGLVPKSLFDKQSISTILKDLNPDSSSYYTAILQNLFFATLSTKKEERRFRSEGKYYKGWNPDFDNQYVFRFQEHFHDPEKMQEYFGEIPFLNGGLFECLDDKKNNIIIDGFSRTKKNQPQVPNFLFFSSDTNADLNADFGTNNKRYTVRGLLNTLSAYNFTIDENEPDDAEIALDPELLGRVFENLLASFNPETSSTARKATGSYYTPREIVDYMVAESLKTYFKTHLENIGDIDQKLDHLFSSATQDHPFDATQSRKLVELIENVKIVDPAVGSGAFPMGALNKLVFILSKVDPGNTLWKQAQLNAADVIPDPGARRMAKEKITEFFEGKNADYGRKLFLIQRCIYGVDIQQIAVEIAKLRFFISLLVDEKIEKEKDNWGIEPLPNLDFKIMQGNSLLEEFEGIKLFDEQLLASPQSIRQEQIQLINRKLAAIEEHSIQLLANNQLTKARFQELNDEGNKLRKLLAKLRNPVNAADEIAELFDSQDNTKQLREQLKSLHADFFVTSDKTEKDSIRQKISDMEWALIEATLVKYNKLDKLKEIEEKRKSKIKPFFLWKLNFAEVFENGGFDIVIGNPPYIQLQKLKGNPIQQAYRNQNFQTFDSNGDIYCLFYEKGMHLLKPSGLLCYITSNKWMRAGYGEKLRTHFLKKNPLILIDMGPGVFESATVDTNILVIQNAKNQTATQAVTISKAGNTNFNIANFLNKHGVMPIKLSKDAWFIGSNAEQNLKEKIERIGKPLKDWDVNIYRGVLTGLNEAFIITTEKRDEILANCKTADERKRTEDIIKPILRGRDIKRYTYEWAGLWVIGTFPALKIKIDDYPALKSFLLKNFDIRKLEQSGNKFPELGFDARKRTGNKWFETQDQIAYYPEFEKEKVVYPNMTKYLPFIFDNEGFFVNQKCFIITSDTVSMKFIVGYFNAKISQKWIRDNCPELQGGTRELSKIFFENIPLPSITSYNETTVQQIENLVEKILGTKKINFQADTSQLENQIDQLVYKLYKLTYDEVKIIDTEFALSQQEYESIKLE